jgi:predicted ferric reductase
MLTEAAGRTITEPRAHTPAGPRTPAGPVWAPRSGRTVRLHGPFLGVRLRRETTFVVTGIVVGLTLGQWWLAAPERWWTSLTTAVTVGGDAAALLGTLVLLLTVLLSARPPWVEKAVGLDTMIRWHRRIAPWGLLLIALHVAAAISSLSLGETTVLRATWDMAVGMPDMLPAYLGFVLLLVVGFSSWHRARRRLRYETWWVIHLYSYLGVGLSLLHELTLGNSLAGRPVAANAWLGLHLAVLAIVLWYRITLPLLRSLFYGLRLEAVLPDGPRGITVILAGRRLHRLPLVGGQFAQFRFCRRDLWWQAHPYSISGLPRDGAIRLTLATTGDYARAITTLRPGTRVLFEGPYGICTAARLESGRKAVLVAGGCGIAPMRSLLDDLPRDAAPVVIYRVHDHAETMLGEEIEECTARLGGRAYLLAGPRSVQPINAKRLADLVPDIAERHIFICGTPSLTSAIQAAARQLDVPDHRIHAEDFAW